MVDESALIQALSQVDTPTVCNAIERLKVRNASTGYCDRSMRQLIPELGAMVGYAVTVQAVTATAEAGDRRENVANYLQVCRAIEQSPKPAVVVIQEITGRPGHSANAGDVLATLFQRFGAVGMVSDGALRDLQAVRPMNFHLFAPGTSAGRGNLAFKYVQTPVTVCGLMVQPGDLLHGDENGLTTIPHSGRDQLLDHIQAVQAKEQAILNYLRQPDMTLDGVMQRMA